MDMATGIMCGANHVVRDDRKSTESGRHLQAVSVVQRPAAKPRPLHGCRKPKPGDRVLARRLRDRAGQPPRHCSSACIRERRDTHTVMATGALDDVDEWVDSRSSLDVDVHPDIWPGFEYFFQLRDWFDAADARSTDGVPPLSVDGSTGIGDPVECAVVEGDQHCVGGGVDIGLKVTKSEVHGGLERPHAVLQAFAGEATMRERQGCAFWKIGMVKERVIGSAGHETKSTVRKWRSRRR